MYSHNAVSSETADYTANADAIGMLRLLEAIRIFGLEKTTRFYQPSTPELYDLIQKVPLNETTSLCPARRMALQSSTATRSWLTIARRTVFMRLTESCLTTRARCGEIYSLPARLRARLLQLKLGRRENFGSATSMPSATGAVRVNMCMVCG